MTSSPARSAVRTTRRDELNETLELMHFGFRALVRGPDARLATLRLGRAQHRLLYFIARQPDQSLQELGSALRITRQALHEGIGPLVRARLVAYTHDAEDRRRRLVRLTPKGRALEDEVSGAQRLMMQRAFRKAGAAGERGWRTVMRLLSAELPPDDAAAS